MLPMEAKVAQIQDLQDGEMREVVVGETKVLLVRLKGKFYALGGECTHYGGPLAEGALSGHRVICPWHQAVFDVMNGDLEEPPALDDEPCYTVRVEGDDVMVKVPEKAANRRTPAMVRRDPADGRTFAILGAGAAGNAAAETMRQDGFTGRVVMITQEPRLPYDRPNLSKGYLSGDAGPEALPWRTPEFYRDHDIEVMVGQRVARVEAPLKTLTFADGRSLKYDGLLLATGGVPRRLEIPGSQWPNVFTLRSADDADAIIGAALPAARVVVIGAGFIGMEAAAALTKRGLAVTVVGHGPIPLGRQLGPEIGGMLQQAHEEQGVAFRLGRTPVRLEGDGQVKAVVLDDGEALPADLVVVGLGVKPATDILRGVLLNADGSVSTDRRLQVTEGLYAAGDVARFPDWRTGEAIRIEHWRLAEQHGRVAAHNMAGRQVEFAGIPFFWSEQFDLFLQYVGHAESWDELIVHGDLAGRNFLGFYVTSNRVMAAAGLQRDRQLAAMAELMRLDQAPAPEELRRTPEFDAAARLKGLQA
jgi:NADPH-dependent 2,4-dienoyl-CoA reductase/sulfur reductase-like enzyme/nitrite reductase/ring-hydroxylating ferredoxin subunit